MRAPLILLLSLAACSGVTTDVRSVIESGHTAFLGVSGKRVVVENLGPGSVELRRRAPSSEIVGTSVLAAGRSYELAAEPQRSIEIVNRSTGAVTCRVHATAGDDGRAQVVILGHRQQ